MHKIGSLKLENNLILAPMAGVGDVAFRTLCRKHGAGLVSSEFVSAEAILRRNPKAWSFLKVDAAERPVSFQLFGNTPERIAEAARMLEPLVDVIDFNIGCPADKITRIACGAALLRDLEKIGRIVRALRNAVSIPVTVKVRSGIDDSSKNAVAVAKVCEENGADMIAVHGRTMMQGYSGQADWSVIGEVKRAVSIPVAANGDIIDGSTAKKCLEQTNADFLMIGRAAMKNPMIFKHITEYFETGEAKNCTAEEQMNLIEQYLELASNYNIGFAQCLRHVNAFTRSLHNASMLRHALSCAKTVEDIQHVIMKYQSISIFIA